MDGHRTQNMRWRDGNAKARGHHCFHLMARVYFMRIAQIDTHGAKAFALIIGQIEAA